MGLDHHGRDPNQQFLQTPSLLSQGGGQGVEPPLLGFG
jgi:hypothetical protein